MKNFWKITVIPGLCCLLAGAVLAVILLLGFSDELLQHAEEFSINEDNFFEFFEADKFSGMTRNGKRYNRSETKESYYYSVPENENITRIDFEFAVGEVDIRTGDTMELVVTDMFEDAISGYVDNGTWYITDSLLESDSVHSNYSPDITITIPEDLLLEEADIYLAAGLLSAECLSAEQIYLEVNAGSLTVFELTAEDSLTIKNGVGEVKVYDADIANMNVDNGVGAVSVTGAVAGSNSITSGIGEVTVFLTDRSRVDFNYSVECGIGEVEIGDMVFRGNSENISYNRETADFFELDCGIGHIEIEVNGN